ncbi:MAG: T9SS type A sorting domain-containing protein [Salinivirgaceae bacterium]|nr:T9SS type A sorting domain-containing protein [Salinivirgaceae bacterium]
MKTIFTLLLMTLYVTVFSFNWTTYGPTGIHANNILFGAGSDGYDVICTDSGVCVNNGVGASWNTINYGLPVMEAIPFDTSNILLVMGNGSYSDGIYKLNLSTNTFYLVEYCFNPTFIKYNTINNTYYAGTRYNGMLSSSDGLTWEAVPYFQDKGCTTMDFYEQHIVVTQENNIFATYYSDDSGNTWNQSSSVVIIHDIAFNQNGILYGVFTGMSNSSGLYISYNFGHTWNIEYYIDNMNTVGFDVLGKIFTGFNGASAPFEGVAIYDTTANNFTFLNTGLPNKNIHKFKVNPVLSSITIFACIDTGVYYCNDYVTSIQNNNFTENNIRIYPNPANDKIEITGLNNGTIQIINEQGQIVKTLNTSSTKTTIDLINFSSGIYIIKAKTDKGIATKKFIIQ